MLDDDAHFKLGYAPAELFFPARDAPNDNAYGSKTSADGGTNHFTKFVPGRDLVDGILYGSRAYTDAITYQFSIFVLNQDTLDNIACNYKAYADIVTIRITTFVPDWDERDKMDVYKFIVWGDVCDNYDAWSQHKRERYGILFRLSSGQGERWEGRILAEFVLAHDSYDALKIADCTAYDYSK